MALYYNNVTKILFQVCNSESGKGKKRFRIENRGIQIFISTHILSVIEETSVRSCANEKILTKCT
jgi:hypothetical protein